MEERELYETVRSDRALFDRFSAIYRGDRSAQDALWWLSNPRLAAPSGAQSPALEVERLRQAVYRLGAGEGEREAYRVAAGAWWRQQESARSAWAQVQPVPVRLDPGRSLLVEEATASSDVPRGRAPRSRRAAVGAGVALLAGAAAGALHLSMRAGPAADGLSEVMAVPTPLVGRIAAAQSRAFRDPESFAAVSAVESIARHTNVFSPRARRLLAAPSSAQGAGVSVSGAFVAMTGSFRYVHDLEAGSRLFVQLLTAVAVDWRWRVVGVAGSRPGPFPVAVVRGGARAGRLQEALVLLPPNVTPVRFEIATTGRTPFRWRSITDGTSRVGD